MFYNNLWWIYQKVAGQYIISVSSVLAMVPMASVLGDVVHVGHSESDAIYQSNAHPRDLFILLLIIRPEFRKDMLWTTSITVYGPRSRQRLWLTSIVFQPYIIKVVITILFTVFILLSLLIRYVCRRDHLRYRPQDTASHRPSSGRPSLQNGSLDGKDSMLHYIASSPPYSFPKSAPLAFPNDIYGSFYFRLYGIFV